MKVRAADTDDIEELARLRAAWREQPVSRDFVASFRDWFLREHASRWWWIAAQGHTVGMVNLKVFDRMPVPDRPMSRWGYLANLFVTSECRGSGVGAALIAAVIDRARGEGLVRVVLSPSELSIPLYGRHGFRPADDLLLLSLGRHVDAVLRWPGYVLLMADWRRPDRPGAQG
ncbi:MAG TPA: GNAT family N-acetyltransferase [Mycobacteriales bacterium]|nr:GNAT family N-acetyltransferase [Mycobacteriales bacterium]